MSKTSRGPRPTTRAIRELRRLSATLAGVMIALTKLTVQLEDRDARTGRPDPRLGKRAARRAR